MELEIVESITVSDDPGNLPSVIQDIPERIRVRDLITAIPQERPGPAPRVITKRGFIGHVVGLSGDSVTVRSDGQSVILLVDDQTEINAPPDMNVGVDVLATDPASRVAVFADRVPDDDPVIALRITVIPSQATRQHTRVVLTGVAGPARLEAVDANGNEINLVGEQDPDANPGDSLVVVFQGNIELGDVKIIGSVKSTEIEERLDNFVDTEIGDPVNNARLLNLRELRDLEEKRRLNDTANNADGEDREVVRATIDFTVRRIDLREVQPGAGDQFINCSRGAINRWRAGNPQLPQLTEVDIIVFGALTSDEQQEIAQNCGRSARTADAEPPQVTLTAPSAGPSVTPGSTVTVIAEATDNVGVTAVAFSVNGESRATVLQAPYQLEVVVPDGRTSLDIEATARDAAGNTASDAIFFSVNLARPAPPTVSITSPTGPTATEGETIVLAADASDEGEVVSVVFTVNGTDLDPIAAPPYSVDYTVPSGRTSLDIVATATDNAGNTAEDSVFLSVGRRAAPLTIEITTPTLDSKVLQGDTVVLNASVGPSASGVGVVFTVGGESSPEQKGDIFSYSYQVPASDVVVSTNPSTSPPHLFVGSVTLDGEPAPDGADISAFVEGSRVDTLEIEATVTDETGRSATDSLSLAVFGPPVAAGDAVVNSGEYTIQIVQPVGQSFSSKLITFKVDGRDAAESTTWQQGAADVLDLTVN